MTGEDPPPSFLLDCLPEPELRANMLEPAIFVTIPDVWFFTDLLPPSSQ